MHLSYPAALPVSERRDDIVAAIREHAVLIVIGDTGSGKTTQLPKMCLEAGRGTAGMIGCTQPRRIAALAVADRLAEEIGAPNRVGAKIRFHDQTTADTLVKFMTDGVLLAETRQDPRLERYDTLIVDEAHERSLNIDFLLGYLK
ncbi:AAA family ATPase, partial [uncultured Desulfobulbus sp.]|uniref:AAA family ATPase n=1 Tax=uncultured Desulfobulbus sp. TaxID=239745 RepID=UPI0026118146